MSSAASILPVRTDVELHRVVWLTLALFLSYLCVAMSLPVISVFVTTQLRFGNAFAGFAVGIAFASTILTRGMAGRMADHHGSKACMIRGLWVYTLAALVCGASSWYLLIGDATALPAIGVVAAWMFHVRDSFYRG